MVLKVFYLNDEKNPILVQVMDQTWDYSHLWDNDKHYHTLQPTEGATFDLICPENSHVWIKKWTNKVLITFAAPDVPEQDPFPRSGAV